MGKKKKKKLTQFAANTTSAPVEIIEQGEEKVEKREVIWSLSIIGLIIGGFVIITIIDSNNGFLTNLSSWLLERMNVLF